MKEEIHFFDTLDQSESAESYGHDEYIKDLLNLEDNETYGSPMKKMKLKSEYIADKIK